MHSSRIQHFKVRSRLHKLLLNRRKCGLTLRSSGPPPGWHLGREPSSVIIRLAAQAPIRRGPLSSNVRRRRMLFLCSSVSTVARNSGTASSAFVHSAKSGRVGTSQPRPPRTATRMPKSSVQLGTKLKFSARPHRLCFQSFGAVKGVTSSRSSPCVSSQSSRTLARTQGQSQCCFFFAHSPRRTQSSWVKCYFGQRQNPAPNPSFEPTPTGKPAVAAQVKR